MGACCITGTSSGIGMAIARRMLSRGIRVFGLSRRPCPELQGEYEGFRHIQVDLLDQASIKRASRLLLSEAKDLSLLVNNAGMGWFGPFEAMDTEDISSMVMLNLVAPMLLTRLLLGRLKQRNGVIVNIASSSALSPRPLGVSYCATKAGLLTFSKALFQELRCQGMKVVTIVPDITETPFYDRLSFGPSPDPDTYLTPDDVADAVEFAVFSRESVVVEEVVIRPKRFRIEKRHK